MELSLSKCIDSLEHRIVEHCAPTLSGIKPASTFSFSACEVVGYDANMNQIIALVPHETLDAAVANVADRLADLGVKVCVLAHRRWSSMVFVWRPQLMSRFIEVEPIATSLEIEGYDVNSVQECVARLRERVLSFDACPRDLAGRDRFPHEIGLLLGYPLEDVVHFVNHRAYGIALRGYWNVYSDVERARRIFSLYDEWTARSLSRFGEGEAIEAVTCGVVSDVSPQVRYAYGA